MSLLATICPCCGSGEGEAEDAYGTSDRRGLIRNGSTAFPQPSAISPSGDSSLDGDSGQGRSPNPQSVALADEQEALRRILTETAMASIDVSALQGTGPVTDFALRASRYEDILRGVSRPRGHRGAAAAGAQTSPVSSALAKVANRREPPTFKTLAGVELREALSSRLETPEERRRNGGELAERLGLALREGFAVKHNEDLVVHINL